MKELLTGFGTDIFRPVVALLLPGIWALAPWTAFIFLNHPALWKFANNHPDSSILVFVVASITVGLIFEDVGARIEALSFKFHGFTNDNWNHYLQRKDHERCIGTGYIRSLVSRMKFELDMSAAGPFALIGMLVLPINGCLKVILFVMVTTITCYLMFEGHATVRQLEDVRKTLNEASELNRAHTADSVTSNT